MELVCDSEAMSSSSRPSYAASVWPEDDGWVLVGEGCPDPADAVYAVDTDLAGFSVITMYLLPEVNLQLRPRLLALKPGTRIVSHDWDMGDWKPDQTTVVAVPDKKVGLEKSSKVHLWVVPARVDGLWCGSGLLKGTSIRLTVVRPGRDKPFDVTITRQIIEIKPVKWEVKDDVGVLTITSFSADATRDLKSAMVSVEKSLGHRPRGWVLDLRSNPGGLLDEAVGVSDLFLDRGEIVSQRGRKKGDIDGALRIAHLGRSSVRYEVALFAPDGRRW